jgi:hypothetical protein
VGRVFAQFLQSDMAHSGAPCLPRDLAEGAPRILQRILVLQVRDDDDVNVEENGPSTESLS